MGCFIIRALKEMGYCSKNFERIRWKRQLNIIICTFIYLGKGNNWFKIVNTTFRIRNLNIREKKRLVF